MRQVEGPYMYGPEGAHTCAARQPVGWADLVDHDLIRSRADSVQACVAPDALDAVLRHVARATVDLDAFVGDFAEYARGCELGHRDLAHGVLAVGQAPSGHVC